jgi:hypothetical protein
VGSNPTGTTENYKIISRGVCKNKKDLERKDIMIKLIICLVVSVAFGWILTKLIPSSGAVAFSVFGYGVSWLLLACLVVAVLVWKRVK